MGLGAVLAALLIAGCVHYQPKPIAPEASLAAFEARRLDDLGLHAYLAANHEPVPTPRQSWRLRALTLASFYFHPDLDVARAELAAARAGALTAGERENPSLSVASGYNSTTSVNVITPWIQNGKVSLIVTPSAGAAAIIPQRDFTVIDAACSSTQALTKLTFTVCQ